ncbi:Na+(H+)/acetate symporter ActP [Spinactinospora alkalitolerans]|uniref:Na+(H+)/acetate symporter ActP n=1 Tax=Spinactinospora alkalitolerans TaxID=687207 RepID=A0A852TY52_9ACTN|nr:cation acetate symporter [Spinactinospora alkalitolerans]NYE48711.1 Na+(H+)/acetate symporter ActP [Spinactinospora alkalitolerans]
MIELVGGALLMAITLLVVLTVAGFHTRSGATSDFTAAVRPPHVLSSAAAVCGEYLSAVTFLGLAGVMLVHGFQVMWLLTAIALGYCVLTALVVAPLRRAGVYSPSDFAEWRLRSRKVRRVVSICVVAAGWLYLLAQFSAAGLLVRRFSGLPGWAGWAALAAIVLVIVLCCSGGSSTGFQAVHFWFKLVAIGVPAMALLVLWQVQDGRRIEADTVPRFREPTSVHIERDQRLRVSESTPVTVSGELGRRSLDGETVRLEAGAHEVAAGSTLSFEAGAAVPHHADLPVKEGGRWAEVGVDVPLIDAYSVYIALALGVVGLPQFVARFYGAPNARTARRTVVVVFALIAVFSIFPVVYAGLGRVYAGDLLTTARTDLLVLELPGRIAPGLSGVLLTALVAAGAAVAVITVSVGLVTALAGTISQCVLGGGTQAFRLGAAMAVGVPLAVSVALPELSQAGLMAMVVPAFRLSAATVAPLLLLGIWWRGLTDAGAAAGLVTGLLGTAASTLLTAEGEAGTGLPADATIVLVPLTFAVMVVVSRLTRRRVPGDVAAVLARMHLPEETPRIP